MPNRYYERGRRAEYEARNILKKQGYLQVYRTAGSHGAADLIAVKPLASGKHRWVARLIQIKTCEEKDLPKYRRLTRDMRGIEFWIKVINKGWEFY